MSVGLLTCQNWMCWLFYSVLSNRKLLLLLILFVFVRNAISFLGLRVVDVSVPANNKCALGQETETSLGEMVCCFPHLRDSSLNERQTADTACPSTSCMAVTAAIWFISHTLRIYGSRSTANEWNTSSERGIRAECNTNNYTPWLSVWTPPLSASSQWEMPSKQCILSKTLYSQRYSRLFTSQQRLAIHSHLCRKDLVHTVVICCPSPWGFTAYPVISPLTHRIDMSYPQ